MNADEFLDRFRLLALDAADPAEPARRMALELEGRLQWADPPHFREVLAAMRREVDVPPLGVRLVTPELEAARSEVERLRAELERREGLDRALAPARQALLDRNRRLGELLEEAGKLRGQLDEVRGLGLDR